MRSLLALTIPILLAVSPAAADRLHLDGGGVIETERWWVEGDVIEYETSAGTVGIPKALVVRVEETETAEPATRRREANRDDDTRAVAQANPESEPQGRTVRVTRELGELLKKAKAALDTGDNQTAAELYERALQKSDADLQIPRIGYALAQIALNRDEAARSVVLEGLARDPEEPALLELLGDLYNRREQVPDALQAWQTAFEQEPNDRLREKILKAERELNAGRDYSFTTSAHFNMRYDRRVDAALSREVTDYLEKQYWVLAERFHHSPSQPITVLLYPTQEFRDVTQSPEWVGGIYDGKIRVPLGGLRRLSPLAEAVLRHELAHAVIHSKTHGRCPRWLHEGLAQVIEERYLPRADRVRLAETMADRDPVSWNEGTFSYPMALSVTLHLQSRKGFDGLVRVLDLLSEGETVESALESVYGAPYERLCRDWAEDLPEGEAE